MSSTTAALLSDNAAAAFLSISRATLWRHVNAGLLPRPIKLGGRTLWRHEELVAAIEKLAAERDGRAA